MQVIKAKTPLTREGVPIYTRTPCLLFNANQRCIVEIICRDIESGVPVDLEAVLDNFPDDEVETSFIFSDAAKPSIWTKVAAELVNGETGAMRATIASGVGLAPGVYNVSAMFHVGPEILYDYDSYAIVERNVMFGSEVGPPLVSSIRTALRDTGPLDNILWEDFAYPDSEIADAMASIVGMWNAMHPPLPEVGTTQFKYTQQWKDATIGSIYGSLAEDFRRNQGTYQSSGGFTFQEGDKANLFTQLSQQKLGAFMAWAAQERVRINMDSFFGASYACWS